MAKKRTHNLYRSLVDFSRMTVNRFPALDANGNNDIRVVELFAGVGGFRVGLENASKRYKTIWNNQWEPATKRQDASDNYVNDFGPDGHSNTDISKVPIDKIPECDLLVGGFPCQDYSVATTLSKSAGIQGKKGVLWWQIHRILTEYKNKPNYLLFENVDRLLKSPAKQRGRDFAIILASLNDLGYSVEWRVINAAEYGMPQRRRRTYILGYLNDTRSAERMSNDPEGWLEFDGVFAKAFPIVREDGGFSEFNLEGDLPTITKEFNKPVKKVVKGEVKEVYPKSPFELAGVMVNRHVITKRVEPNYAGPFLTLGDILLDEDEVPEEFFITNDEELAKWKYLKGSKSMEKTSREGYTYNYSEGGMAFPDPIDKPSRTIITGEGGKGPSRFKHVVATPSGRLRRLTPIELERLDMFPDNHTECSSDVRRAFLMGNALVTGIVEKVGVYLINEVEG